MADASEARKVRAVDANDGNLADMKTLASATC